MLGVVYVEELVVIAVPPFDAAYQSMNSPEPGVAEMVTGPDEHLEPAVPLGADGKLLIVADTAVLVFAVILSTTATKFEVFPVKAKLVIVPSYPFPVMSINVVVPVLFPDPSP